ncbi:hypothetical protein SHIRM173S_00998 [Streptomyces hirsutus]
MSRNRTPFSRTRRRVRAAAGLSSAMLLLSACGGMSDSAGEAASGAGKDCESRTKVRVVLQWVAQAQFAGYYAAKEKGYYDKACLDVTIQEGGVNVVPQQVLSAGNAEFAVSHVAKTMVTREQGADLVNIGQAFQRGAYLQVGLGRLRHQDPRRPQGQARRSWGYGNELTLFAAMRGSGVETEEGAEMIQQPVDMSLLLKREVDAAQAKTYNSRRSFLETTNPKRGSSTSRRTSSRSTSRTPGTRRWRTASTPRRTG